MAFICENAGKIDCQISKTIQLLGGLHPKLPQRGISESAAGLAVMENFCI